MKFGKVLQESAHTSKRQWGSYWIDYKKLKGIVKDCVQIDQQEKLNAAKLKLVHRDPDPPLNPTSDTRDNRASNEDIAESMDEKNFFRTLHGEMNKISEFFILEQRQIIGSMASIDRQYQTLVDQRSKVGHIDESAKIMCMASCVNLYKELLLLENFAILNYCGISKILKKHDKWTQYTTREKFLRQVVSKTPFATYQPLLQMINQLERIFMDMSGCSIDQHEVDSSKSKSPCSSSSSSEPTALQLKPAAQTKPRCVGEQPLVLPSMKDHSDSLEEHEMKNVSLPHIHAIRNEARQMKKNESLEKDTETMTTAQVLLEMNDISSSSVVEGHHSTKRPGMRIDEDGGDSQTSKKKHRPV